MAARTGNRIIRTQVLIIKQDTTQRGSLIRDRIRPGIILIDVGRLALCGIIFKRRRIDGKCFLDFCIRIRGNGIQRILAAE